MWMLRNPLAQASAGSNPPRTIARIRGILQNFRNTLANEERWVRRKHDQGNG